MIEITEQTQLIRSKKFYFDQINPYWFFEVAYKPDVLQSFQDKYIEMDQYQIVKLLKELESKSEEDINSELKSQFEKWSGLSSADRTNEVTERAKQLLDSKMDLDQVNDYIDMFYKVMNHKIEDKREKVKKENENLNTDSNEVYLWNLIRKLTVTDLIANKTKRDNKPTSEPAGEAIIEEQKVLPEKTKTKPQNNQVLKQTKVTKKTLMQKAEQKNAKLYSLYNLKDEYKKTQ